MLTLQDLHCPMCGNGAVKKGKGNYILCVLHGWVEAVKAISLNAAKQHKSERAGK